jgi:CheY-like chemotaxis protein
LLVEALARFSLNRLASQTGSKACSKLQLEFGAIELSRKKFAATHRSLWLGSRPRPATGKFFFVMRRKVLVVDDDPAVRHMLCRLLREEDYLVDSASNGTEALEVINSVDLVLLDLTLPGNDGWQVFEKIHSQNRAVSVIIITARHNQVFPALASGAGALMEKPLDLPKLLSIIRELLNESEQERMARLAGHAADFHYLAPEPIKLQPQNPHDDRS